MKLVIHPPVEPERLERITAAAAPMTVVNAASEDQALAYIHDADAFFGKMTPSLLAAAGRLRWVQAPTASNSQNWRWVVVDDPGKKAALAELYRGFEKELLVPLWTEIGDLMPAQPRSRAVPHLWKWDALLRLADQAGHLVPVGRGGERRAGQRDRGVRRGREDADLRQRRHRADRQVRGVALLARQQLGRPAAQPVQ